jgi:hypothetical protein
VSRPDRSGDGERKALVGDVVGETATVVARFKGGGTVRSGVSVGDTAAASVSFALFREADRVASRPKPKVALRVGVLKPVEAGEPRLPVLPGTMGKAALVSDTGPAAIPSQSISSIG